MATTPNHWQRIINDYFVFSKGQRRAVIVLLAAIVMAIFLPAIYRFLFVPAKEKADHAWIEQVAALRTDSVKNTLAAADEAPATDDHNKGTAKLFNFDPNTATSEQWQTLGLKDKTIQTIQRYLSRGGHFNKAEDIKKIYGLPESDAVRLLPYVRIDSKADAGNARDKSTYSSSQPFNKPKPIDINLSDTSAFISLPGIGSKLAARIVNFREKLGGFYKIEQVAETYGLPDSTFQKIRSLLFVSKVELRTRKINTASVDELKSPYIPYNVANAIVQYRIHNGNFQSVEGLKKIPLIDEALYEKIAPYLSAD